MPDIDVFFATNRNRLPDTGGVAAFGDLATPDPRGIAFGSATVTGVNDDDPSAGQISRAEVFNFGGIGPELGDAILHEQNDLFVFVHGADNSFADSLQRAAFNASWINASGAGRVTALAFSWPAMAYDLAGVIDDAKDYRHDQAQAAASAQHCADFLGALIQFKAGIGQRRICVLAHSMGNYMLGFGVERFFATHRDPHEVFDQVVLAAPDEFADTFDAPNNGRLSRLADLTPAITVYSSRDDILMEASRVANGDWRLGYDGPPDRANTTTYPTSCYTFVDCSNNRDFTTSFLAAPDRTHQYYRQTISVRTDIARLLKTNVPPAGRLYNTARNVTTIPVP